MTAESNNVPLWLVRSHLRDIPDAALAPGLSLRPLNGDEDRDDWFRLIRAAETLAPIEDDAFTRAYGSDPAIIADRVCFIENEAGRPIATVGAWYGIDQWEGWGRIHWLYILPEFQGRGIGKALLTFALHRLVELGHDRVFLKTSTGRIPALRLYYQYGFINAPESN